MSRIASYPIELPKGVEVAIGADDITVKGQQGELRQALDSNVKIEISDNQISFGPANGSRHAAAMAGTMRSLVNNMVVGVSAGFARKLNLIGVGFRAQAQGQALRLQLGFSHDIVHELPEGITAECPSATKIIIKGMDKQVVGQVAAEIRGYRPPEPYKGKGVRYEGEQVSLKDAKKA